MMNALTKKIFLKLSPPKSGDVKGDKERIIDALKEDYQGLCLSKGLLKKIYPLCRLAQWEITLTMINLLDYWEIIEIEPGDTRKKHYGIAIDLGSTSITMAIVDLITGKILGEESQFNEQIVFGDDILTRIFCTKGKPEYLKDLQCCLIKSFEKLFVLLEEKTGISPEACSSTVISGNTTMIHFLLGIDPWPIFESPFAPVFNHTGFFYPESIGLAMGGILFCMPSVANYLGGDTVSGLLMTDLLKSDALGLFIDIGTNGEMVLGNKRFLLGGAGAAGPALEGGISKNGMRASPGAVDSILIKDNTLSLSTIGNKKPLGICGSGIVDLLAQMLLNGWIDFSGRFNWGVSNRIVKHNGEFAVVYAWKENSETGEPLVFTQRDLNQFMDTKAAAATMLTYLLDSLEIKETEIKKVYTSGAFGTYINLESAITIGLYPDLPRDRFINLGNSSLNGAIALLLNQKLMPEVERIQKSIEYLEFGAATDFLTRMYAARFLPHTELNRYPSVKAKLLERGLWKL